MKVLGITLRKNELHYTVIEGEMQKEATLLEIKKDKHKSHGKCSRTYGLV